jgi:hypothetical protein
MPTTAAAPPTRAPRRRRLANAATQPEGVRVTSLMLPRDLYERSRIAGIRLNWSWAELVRTALAAWLDAHEPKAPAPKSTRRAMTTPGRAHEPAKRRT